MVGTALHESMPERALQRYGFRIPFLCGFLVALAGLALHKYVPDIAEIEEDVGPGSPPTSPSSAATAATPSAAVVGPLASASVAGCTEAGGSTTSGSERALSLSASGGAVAMAPAVAAAAGAVTPPNPLKDLWRGHKLELVSGTTVLFLYCTAFYECLVWLPVRFVCVYTCIGDKYATRAPFCCDPIDPDTQSCTHRRT